MPLEGSFCTNHARRLRRISQHNEYSSRQPFLGASTPSIRTVGRVCGGVKGAPAGRIDPNLDLRLGEILSIPDLPPALPLSAIDH